jgi:hypothetical protein
LTLEKGGGLHAATRTQSGEGDGIWIDGEGINIRYGGENIFNIHDSTLEVYQLIIKDYINFGNDGIL